MSIQTTVHTTERVVPGGAFGISFFDLPRSLQFDPEGGLKAAARPGEMLVATRPVKHQGVEALIGDFEGGDNSQRLMVLLVHRRVYAIGVYGKLDHWDFFVENFRIDRNILDGSFAREQAKPKPAPIQPLTMYEVHDTNVFEQERIYCSFVARGGRAPYNWVLDGVQKDWKQTADPAGRHPGDDSLTACSIEGRSGPGEFTVNATVTDADGRKASGTMKIRVVKLPEVVAELKLHASPNSTTEMPAASGHTVATYPGVHTSFKVWAECLLPRHYVGTATFECKDEFLPPHGSSRGGTQDIEFSGYWQELGDFKFTVSAEVNLRGIERTFTLSKEFTLSVVPLPEEIWPKTPGEVEVKDGVADVGREYTYQVASVVLRPTNFPLAYGNWQATVKWSWDEVQLPPGMKVKTEDCAWLLIGSPTTAGNYVVEVKGTVTLKWISKAYEVAERVVIRVDER